ncbi:E3 ubiquitin-protein ligase ZNRF2 [Echinococcus granulosus]|uniref:E3 ubiquitin-protein ligase ZNRF1 n=1 Tax=Echinococcus granulosus TaxID=6210 RepID=A0A068WLD3_ECHGR|nr:E3 ubiquitin-protein ligase ZNRF2 [Echinococcus granulosus]CDS18479.1 Zinc finger RING type [Echinococcus granulosus]
MGMRMSSTRFDSSDVASAERLSPHSHHHHRSSSPTTGPRARSLSHNHQHTAATGSASTLDEPGSSSGHRTRRGHGHTGHNVPPMVMLDRLIADIEANGGVISPDDPRIIRLLQVYRTSAAESGEASGRARPVSVLDADSLFAGTEGASMGRGHRSRRSGGRHHSPTAVATAADDGALEERLSAVRRQVLLSLTAASSSSPHRRRQWPESLLLLSGRDRPCIFCKRMIPHDDYDLHYVMCLTRPRVTYNEDTLQTDKGECSICLEDMKAGDRIARLPCLCIYHKKCIDNWFQRKQTCPEHPGD